MGLVNEITGIRQKLRTRYFFCTQLEVIDLFAVFEYDEHVSVLSIFSIPSFSKNLKKLQRLEQFAISQAMHSSRGLISKRLEVAL